MADQESRNWFEVELGKLVNQGQVYPEEVAGVIDRAKELEARVADLEATVRKLENKAAQGKSGKKSPEKPVSAGASKTKPAKKTKKAKKTQKTH